MKLKQEPEDFRVQELIDFREARGGRFFIHLLRKRKMETLHALAVVAREAGLSSGEIGYAGLKDRQAVTTQLVSLPGRRISIRRRDLEVRFLGRSEEPISAALARGNRFELMLRALDEGELEHLARNLEEVRGSGLPNYFDDQRFGCLKHGQGLILRKLLDGRPGDALKDLMAAPSRFDPAPVAGLKAALAAAWGDWGACASIARKLRAEAPFQHLRAQPGDLFGAFHKVPRPIRLIHLYAFQSFYWNRALSEHLRGALPRAARLALPTEIGWLAVHRSFGEQPAGEWGAALLPLPAGDLAAPAGEGLEAALFRSLVRVLEDDGLALGRLATPRRAGLAFKGEPRPVLLRPADLQVGQPEADERNQGLARLRLAFSLPRGAYATLVVKRLLARPQAGPGREFSPRRPGPG